MRDIETYYVSFDKIQKLFKTYAHSEMKDYDLTPNEIQVLNSLGMKNTSSEIAKDVNVSKALVSRSVKLLLKKGYITVNLSELDKRELIIKPTEEGDKIRKKIIEVRETFTRKAFKNFGDEEFTVLKALTGLILKNLSE